LVLGRTIPRTLRDKQEGEKRGECLSFGWNKSQLITTQIHYELTPDREQILHTGALRPIVDNRLCAVYYPLHQVKLVRELTIGNYLYVILENKTQGPSFVLLEVI